jgi:hypothetical protein
MNPLSAEGKHELTRDQKLQRVLDYEEIANLMARKEYYHSAQKNQQELDELWANDPDDVFAQNQGYFVGMKNIEPYYGLLNVKMQAIQLAEARKVYPQIPDSPASYGVGMYIIHSLTTQIIEVAGDGKTAKGVWYSPGMVIGPPDSSGKPTEAVWLWERYGVDFLKQSGVWKVWHAHVYTDLAAPTGKDIAQSMIEAGKKNAAPMGNEGSAAKSMDALMAEGKKGMTTGPDYKQWSPTTVPAVSPRLPVPYYTFSETFSYGKE